MKRHIAKLAITFILLTNTLFIPSKLNAFTAGLLSTPPVAIVSLTILAGISGLPILSDIYGRDQRSRNAKVSGASIFGSIFAAGLGFLMLNESKNKSFYEFKFIDAKVAQKLKMTEKERSSYNNNLEEINTLMQELTYELKDIKNLNNTDLKIYVNFYTSYLSKDTKSSLKKIFTAL
jgi:hypothetical protein